MSVTQITCRRTVGMVRSLYSTALALTGFFAACGILFSFSLESAEGGSTPLSVIWTVAVSPVLPVLASLLAMDVWSDERRTGRVEALLTAPVRERDLTLGKFLGVFAVVMGAAACFLVTSLIFVLAFAPSLLAGASFMSFLLGFAVLSLQGALWCAVALACSAVFRHSAAAALTAVALTCAIPRGIWFALMSWAPQGRLSFGEMPLDAHAFDLSSGLVSTATVLSYLTLTAFALFLSSKATAALRFLGRGARSLKWSTCITLVLAAALAGSLLTLYQRLDRTIELPLVGKGEQRFSARTRNILAETHGEISVTAFLSRKDARFRPLGHFLRALSRETEAVGGAHLGVRYVDPRWDLGAAERLVRLGAHEDALVFERGRRHAILPLRDGFGERMCASAILRVAMPPMRQCVYWTKGHGESSFEAYGTWGMSDIARDLSRDGYRNQTIDLARGTEIPADCALIIIAGAKSDFSRAEVGCLDAYLRKGGRLLLLVSSAEAGGVATVLSGWGMRPVASTFPAARTLSGTDVIVSDFADHPVSEPLNGSQLVLEKPVAFMRSAAAETGGTGADRIEFSALASVGEQCVAAVSERGVGAGQDLSIRPTRIIAVGDSTFVMNGQLAARANANRDFFLNCVAYLSGTDAITETGTEADRLVSGMDRFSRLKFVISSALVLPGVLFVLMTLSVALGRRRA